MKPIYVEAYVRYIHFVEGIHNFVEHGSPQDLHLDLGTKHQQVRDAESHDHVR